MSIREPVVAGQFYPEDPKELQYILKSLLKDSKIPYIKGDISGLIVPHAGYEFSGKTAAYAFKQIEGKKYDTVIIIGPSHNLSFENISVYPEGAFKTPLGKIEIDEKLAGKIINSSTSITSATEPHQEEHSIEVLIPFLQVAIGQFKIVPICMGGHDWVSCETLATALANHIDKKNTLIIASSDFYHGYDYEECRQSVAKSVFLINNYNTKGFYRHYYEQHAACGGAPIVSLMLTGEKLNIRGVKLMHSTNSSDASGNKQHYIVGYASFLILESKYDHFIDKKDRISLLKIARMAVNNVLRNKSIKNDELPESEMLMQKQGCFVSIKGKNNKSCGSTGYVLPVKPLYQAVPELAVEAVMKNPKTLANIRELSELKFEISVITALQPVESIEDIQIGRDGIYIKADNNVGFLLPQFAVKEGLNRIEFVERACWKAGLPSDAWKKVELFKFEAEMFGDED